MINRSTFKLIAFLPLVFSGFYCASQTFINELMASNQLALFDDFFESDDWLELYHEGGVLNLAGYYLSDREDNLTKWQFPSTNGGVTTILPNGHMVVWLDNDEEQGEDHTNFKLSPDGEGIYLTAPDGVTIIDFIIFPLQQTDVSYGRECDGCNDWVYFDIPTPDEENMQTTPQTPLLYINEVLISNESNLVDEFFDLDPWIEIYNPNSFQVNLSSYVLSDSQGQTTTFTASAPYDLTVEAEGFLLLWLDGEPNQGGHHIDFIPSQSANNLTLKGPDGIIAATYEYEVGDDNVSWGRQSDGSPTSVWFNTPTPRVSNTLFIIPPPAIAINEIQSSNLLDTTDFSGAHEDWFEIINLSESPVDLGGMYLTDRLNQSTKYQIPLGISDSTTIAPGGFMLIFADEDNSQGWNHTNFKFNSDGEAIVIRSIDGFSIADSAHFPSLVLDHSWGRDIDGSGDWRIFSPEETTPEYCNVCTNGVGEVSELRALIYPNPISSGMMLNVSESVDVYDLHGRIVNSINSVSGYEIQLDPGLYLVTNRGKNPTSGKSQRLIVLE